jgi:peroxiredoxin
MAVVALTAALVTVGCSSEPRAATSAPLESDSGVSPVDSSASGEGDRLEPIADPSIADPSTTAEVTPAVADTPPAEAIHQSTLDPHARIGSTLAPMKLTSSSLPEVKMSVGHASLSAVQTDDSLPEIALPDLKGEEQELSELYGEYLTVVFFWKGDRALARAELADLGPDVVTRYEEKGVKVVGIAVGETAETAEKHVTEAGATYPVLVDADGSALALVGTEKLPRTYLVNSAGEVLWFDIEYSRATRRGLRAAIRAALEQIPREG